MPKTTKGKTLTKEDITKELIALDRIVNALNTAIVALYYIVGVNGNELDKVSPEEYVKYVQEKIHPIVRKADEISKEVSKAAAKEAKKAVEE